MYARAVDDAAERLRDLRHEEWDELGLGACAITLAVGTTQIYPELAIPLFLGGLVVVARGVWAFWRHWDLLERLAGERDAYVISEVLAHASRAATMERRHDFAASIRGDLSRRDLCLHEHAISAVDALEALAAELDDDELALDPACAVACMRLLDDPVGSPLLDPMATSEELRSRICQIRCGFSPRQPAA